MSGEDIALRNAMYALNAADKRFTMYAEHHQVEGAEDKAATNYCYALECRNALEALRIVYPGIEA